MIEVTDTKPTIVADKPGIKIGDEARYFPHALYAKEPNRNGTYPWAFGWNTVVQEGRESRIEVRPLSQKELKQKLDYLARHTDPSMERKRLVPMRPLDEWAAKVRTVNKDGTVDLDVTVGTRSGVTLSFKGIAVVEKTKVDELRSAAPEPGAVHHASVLAHTCYVVQETP